MEAFYISLGLGVLAALGILLAAWSLQPAAPTNADVVEGRLRLYETGMPATLAEIELRASLADRVLRPALKRIGRLVEQTMPETARQSIHAQLQLAGCPNGLSGGDFIALRYVMTGVLCVTGAGVGLLTDTPAMVAVGAAVGGVLGMYIPTVWLRMRVSRRRLEILLALPDVIDLLIVCVEAGLSFDAAIERVVDKYDHALAGEFDRVLHEMRVGRPRLEALEDMGRRSGVDELNNFVQAVIQSEQLGAGIVRILRIQSDEIRQKRLLSAQERGARASLKMLLPMVGCIFPTLWVILLGPAALLLLKGMAGR